MTDKHHLLPTLSDAIPFSRPGTPGAHGPLAIGFVGLGAMGRPMARNLAQHRASHTPGAPPQLVWNRTLSKAEKLVAELGEDKVQVAQTPGEIALECDIIITSLSGDEGVKAMYQQFAAALQQSKPTRNKIFVETSTIYPTLAGELDAIISAIPHCHLVTAPVLGPPASAEDASLVICMSGDYRSKKELAHLLVPAVGRKVYDLGGNLEKAPTFKLIGNSIILGSLEVLAEAFTMGEKSNIGQDMVYQFIKDMMPAPLLLAYGDKMLHDKFDGSKGFAIDGGIKDATHIRKLTAEHNSPMPVVDTAHQHLLTARALHAQAERAGNATFPILDWSALVAGTRAAAGLDALDSNKHSRLVRED